ncbi:MAG: hypothetical protein AAFZ07_21035 [Actinomycetota bacterium]
MARKRATAGALALVLATIGTIVLVAYVRGAEERALEGEDLVEVLVVEELVGEGTTATELARMTRIEVVPRKVRADGALAELTTVDGLVTSTALLPGEQLVSQRFVTPDAFTRDGVPAPPGLMQTTISLSPERALGGAVAPGDTVGVVASFEPFDVEVSPGLPGEGGVGDDSGDELQLAIVDGQVVVDQQQTPNTSHFLLHDVLVTNVQLEQLPTVADGDDDASPRAIAPTGNLLVTLALDAPSIERLVFTAEFGHLWLTIDSAEATDADSRIQNRGSVYIPTDGGPTG